MTSQARKAKGRRLQQAVCSLLAKASEKFGLVTDDFLSRSMGANGEDVMFSPAAVRVYGDLKVECKNCESLNVPKTFFEHADKYPKSVPVLVHKRNRTDALCTIRLTHFIDLISRSNGSDRNKGGA